MLFTRACSAAEMETGLGFDVSVEGELTWQQGKLLEAEIPEGFAQVARVGADGDLTFVIGEYGPLSRKVNGLAKAVSRKGRSFLFYRNTNGVKRFTLSEDGEVGVLFNPASADIRSGQRPDQLTHELIEAGLLREDGTRQILDELEAELRMLHLLERTFSLTLPKALIEQGRMTTVFI
jgi:hypothetical protein